MTPSQINRFLFFKLPSAYFCGVRVRYMDGKRCVTTVKHRWFNQNPFRSLFWAVQGMTAELSTGALVVAAIRESGESISMLVTRQEGTFLKKARGRIVFECEQGELVSQTIMDLGRQEPILLPLRSVGKDEKGDIVAEFNFEWSLKRR